MRIGVVLAIGILFSIDTTATAQPKRGRDQDAARYGWLPSLAEGKVQARKTGKPIMVVMRCVP